jgi:L-rhamnono-1,4-lactonase
MKILDTHIHLWPSTSISPTNHGWMTPGHRLAKRHGISDYHTATSSSPVKPAAFIYVETDRYLPAPRPEITEEELEDARTRDDYQVTTQKLANWAHEPLEELRFLRRIMEGKPEEGDGLQPGDGDKMVGCVIWAPFHLPAALFDFYMGIAEQVAGRQLWQRVVGFRYLVQGIKDETTFRQLVGSENWLRNILRLRSGRGGRGWAFDIGVDTHGSGVWQVEAAADMVEKIRTMEADAADGRVTFVLNHLCKPDLSTPEPDSRSRWLSAVKRLAAFPAVYVKLSGALNEFTPSPTPSDPVILAERLDFYTRNILELFGSHKVMFGSDWPVCNIGGPNGEHKNWGLWRQVVEKTIEKCGVKDSDFVWRDAGCEAYGVEL